MIGFNQHVVRNEMHIEYLSFRKREGLSDCIFPADNSASVEIPKYCFCA